MLGYSTENTIRPSALERKNGQSVVNKRGGKWATIINSLVMTCKENKIDFKVWLSDILPQLAKTSAVNINTLLAPQPVSHNIQKFANAHALTILVVILR